jgi:hypothetical protein
MRTLLAALTAAASLAVIVPSAHAEVWSAPQTIERSPTSDLQLSVSPDGAAALAWSRYGTSPLRTVESNGVAYATRTGPGSPFAAPRAIGGPNSSAVASAPGADGTARLLWHEQGGELLESAGPLGGELSAGRPTGVPGSRYPIDAATDEHGNALATWVEHPEPYTDYVPYIAWRPAGANTFGPHLRVGDDAWADVAIDREGRGIAAMVERGEVRVVTCDAAGCDGGQKVSDPITGANGWVQVSVGRRGHVAVVWTVGNAAAVAVRSPGGGEFSTPTILRDPRSHDTVGVARAAVDDSGGTLLAWWTGYDLHSSYVPLDGTPTPVERVPGSDTGSHFAVGYDAYGNGVVAWVTNTPGDYVPYARAAERRPDGTWTDAQLVARFPSPANGRGSSQMWPAMAFDDRGGGVFAWAVHPEASLYTWNYDGREVASLPAAKPEEPPPAEPAPQPAPVARANVALLGARATRKDVRVRFKLDHRAHVAVAIRRRGSAKSAATARRSVAGRPGRNRVVLAKRLRAGRYFATAVVRSPAGRSSDRIRFRVKRRVR